MLVTVLTAITGQTSFRLTSQWQPHTPRHLGTTVDQITSRYYRYNIISLVAGDIMSRYKLWDGCLHYSVPFMSHPRNTFILLDGISLYAVTLCMCAHQISHTVLKEVRVS